VQADQFDEEAFFRALARMRCLLIGRRALVALSLPVLTADYDLWLHRDDFEVLNALLAPLDLVPTRSPEDARSVGRYVLENGEHVVVLVARAVSTVDGVLIPFDEVWERREHVAYGDGLSIALPSLDDLILAKRFAAGARTSSTSKCCRRCAPGGTGDGRAARPLRAARA